MSKEIRLAFLIDGFNVYHSIVALERKKGNNVKWLDLYRLCNSYCHLFGKTAKLESVYYFSALALHLQNKNPGRIKRHRIYIKCLKDSAVKIELGRFKKKSVYCKNCSKKFMAYEEKETDVAIAVKVLELFSKDLCDTIVILSGDTDLSPVIRSCQNIFPNKKVVFAFPYARKNKELIKLAPNSFSIHPKQYLKYQFPDPYIFSNGKKISKPKNW
jgi:uncharacterized LabA/DUF88 family protein